MVGRGAAGRVSVFDALDGRGLEEVAGVRLVGAGEGVGAVSERTCGGKQSQ